MESFTLNKCTSTGLHSPCLSVWFNRDPRVHMWPPERGAAGSPGSHVTAPKETDVQQTSFGNECFIKTMLITTIILRDNIDWNSIWQVLPWGLYYIYHTHCMSSTFLNMYTYIIYMYTQKSHWLYFLLCFSCIIKWDFTHTHTHTHTHGSSSTVVSTSQVRVRTLCPWFSG